MQELGSKLRRQRLRLALTLDDLAARTGISKPYLSLIETGRAGNPPRDEKLRTLERALRFDDGELLALAHLYRTPASVRAALELLLARAEGTAAAMQGCEDPLTGVVRHALRSMANHVREARLVPVINTVSAGYPRRFNDLSFPRTAACDYVCCPGIDDPDAFAARVHGDSMLPRYRPGDIVVFAPQRSAQDGDDCFIRLADGQTTFKRLFRETDDQGRAVARLQPRNERYRAQTLPTMDLAGAYPAVCAYQRLDAE